MNCAAVACCLIKFCDKFAHYSKDVYRIPSNGCLL